MLPLPPRGGALVLAALAFAAAAPTALSNSDDSIPQGTLNIDRDLVRAGTHTQLDWEIHYPSGIDEIIDIVPPNRIVPKKNVRMKVRVLGVAFQTVSSKSNNGHGNNTDGVDSSNPGKGGGGPNGADDPSGDYDDESKGNGKGKSNVIELPLDAYWSKNGLSWDRFFYGTGPSVNPSEVLVSEWVKKGDVIDFGARGWNRDWLPFHHTRDTDPYVTVLKNGERAPSYAPAYNQDDVVSFLGPYIDAGGRIKIGERDLIVLWEASTAYPGSPYFDMQDLVVLLTFE